MGSVRRYSILSKVDSFSARVHSSDSFEKNAACFGFVFAIGFIGSFAKVDTLVKMCTSYVP